ncbi:MAG TPA: hypothetical protein VLA48_06215 [Nitrososphaeraceae archaeon]|nr:hypothetical protein [Nitrososphaeraceae archaeon]
MLKCKTCGQVFPGTYIAEGSNNNESKSHIALKNEEFICSRGHINDYITEDFMDFS